MERKAFWFVWLIVLVQLHPVIADEWLVRAPLPEPREGASGAVVNGKVYIMHGFSDGDSNHLRIYDPAKDSWSSGPTSPGIPSCEAYFGAAADDGFGSKVYLIGGGSAGSQNLKFDPITNTWLSNARTPTPRGGHGVAVVDNLIYAMGGRDAPVPFSRTPLDANEVYNPITDEWTLLTPLPSARAGVGAVAWGGKIYVIGGWKVEGSTPILQNIVEVYDPSTDTWSSAAAMPTARAYFGVTECGGKIYAIGGMISTNPVPDKMSNVVEVYDPAKDAWSKGVPMPLARAELVTVTVDNTIYAIGGGIFGMSVTANQSFTCR